MIPSLTPPLPSSVQGVPLGEGWGVFAISGVESRALQILASTLPQNCAPNLQTYFGFWFGLDFVCLCFDFRETGPKLGTLGKESATELCPHLSVRFYVMIITLS